MNRNEKNFDKTGIISCDIIVETGTETIIESKSYPFNHNQDKTWLSPSLGASSEETGW